DRRHVFAAVVGRPHVDKQHGRGRSPPRHAVLQPARRRGRLRGRSVGAERRVEAKRPAKQRHEILERAVVLFAGGGLAARHERGTPAVGAIGENPPETLTRGVESRRVVQSAGEREQLVEQRGGHAYFWTRMAGAAGSGGLPVASSVTRTPVTRFGK